jgi:hybrid cluster-associated redox disulfide protein
MTPQDVLAMIVADALEADPRRARVFLDHGLACVGCPMSRFETVEQVAAIYGIDPLALAAALVDPPGAAADPASG